MAVDYISRAKLMSRDFAAFLGHAHEEGFGLIRPIGIAHPQFIFARSRNLDVLPDDPVSFVGSRSH